MTKVRDFFDQILNVCINMSSIYFSESRHVMRYILTLGLVFVLNAENLESE